MVDNNTSTAIEGIPMPEPFSPTLWNDLSLIKCLDNQVQERYAKEVEALKKEVRTRLSRNDGKEKATDKLKSIDAFERLGISYHFEHEIEEQLNKIYESRLNQLDEHEDHDLFSTALRFRILRQHGYKISCAVFDQFYKDKSFEESVGSDDINGLISLYEATSIRFHNEDILEEALAFVVRRFKRMDEGQLDSSVHAEVIKHVLGGYTFHRGVHIAEAWRYLSLYRKEEAKDELVLRLAELDLSLTQNGYQKELCDLARWWKSLDIVPRLSYTRDRIVESYFWGVALNFEPHYSFSRIAVAKTIQILALVNDTYDSYATLDEIETFTEVLQSWDSNKTDLLSDYMKIVFHTLLSFYEDFDRELSKQGRSFAVTYAIEAMKQLCKGYHANANWFLAGKMPTFDEYSTNGVITSAMHTIFAAAFFDMESATEEVYEWMMSSPKIMVATGLISRALNDIGSYERESREGQVLTPVDCYMEQYGTSIEQTRELFLEMVENTWKDINEECVSLKTSIPRDILLRVLDLARVPDITYKHGVDGYTTPKSAIHDNIVALFIDPIPVTVSEVNLN